VVEVAISVLLADDQPLVRTGLRAMIDMEPDMAVVGEATDGAEALGKSLRLAPDVILMDIQMPGMDGITATSRIRERAGDGPPRVIVLTTFDDEENVFASLRAGASGFLLKDATPEHLLEAIRIVHRGEALLSPQVTRQVIAEYARRSPKRSPPRGFDQLTARETEVFRFVARGVSNGDIARELVLAEETVRTHVKRILMKLDLRDRVQVVVAAYESGLVQPGEA
jgi:DNA-binding NarL/FixJ family response regulator